MKKNLLILLLAFCNFGLLNAQMTITEIFYNAPNAGSDTIEYIELYNGSSMMLDLNGYSFSQGVVYTFPANTTVAPGDYIVVANDSAVMMDVLGVNSYEWASGGLNNDGEDIQLNDSSSIMVDYVDYLDGGLWPTTADGDGYAMELCDVTSDNTDPANWSASLASTGILIESVLIYGTPGATNTATCSVLPPSTEDIVITEIMYNPPGSDAIGEYLELYNKGTIAIDLTDFYFTGGITHTFDNQMMMPGQYLVLAADSAAIESLYGITPRQWTAGGLTNAGEDIVLVDASGAVVDVVNYNNNSPWPEIADGDGTSAILCDVNADNDDAANWSFSTNNTGITSGGGNDIIFASPGAANTCATAPYLFFNGTTDVTNEGNGTDMFAVRMANTGMMDTADVDIVIMGSGTATDGVDYTIINTTLHFSPEGIGESSVAFIDMALLDDTDIEADETVVIQMANPTMGATIATDGLFTITIEDNDGASYPTYPIGTVTTVDVDGVADSVGVECSLTGVVHGVNMRPSGLQFTFIDQNNDGIGLFYASGNFGYTVAEGDLVTVEGTISQFNGLTQINPDTVMMISSGNPLWNPDVVSSLSEANESQMTQMECVTLADPTQWTNSGSGFNVDIVVGMDTVQMRVDADTDVYGTTAPTGEFTVTGIGGQFDSSSPYDGGYQLIPRYIADVDQSACSVIGTGLPVYPIGDVSSVDADGVTDSLGVVCGLIGTVHGVNMRPSGLQFTFIDDNNDGIGLFYASGNFGYTVTEGDRVLVEGTISQFNGLTQINPDSVFLISQNNPLFAPDIVTALSEATESQMTQMECVTLADPTQWTNSGSGFNVDVVVGMDTVQMRVDADTDVYGTAAPTGEFTITGIGGQFDSSVPHDEGYQLIPRYIADVDVVACLPPILDATDDNVTTDVDVPITITVLANDNTPNGTTTLELVDLPVFGTAVINTDLTITYTPDLGTCGLDAFSYVVCDASPLCDTANVVITVECEVNIPLYDIGDINNNDPEGSPDSLGVLCEIRGIVYGVNLRPAGLQFTIIDADDKEEGIANFLGSGNFGYTVAEGDEVGIFGTVGFFNGLTQMSIDSVYLISSANPLHDPETITDLNEDTESKLVKIFNLTLDDPTEWTNMGSGFNVSASDGTNTYQIRIDNDVDVFGTNPPVGVFNVTGLGGQFDNDSPYDSGYQIFPRYLPDFEMSISADDIELENKVHVFPNPTADVLFVGSEVQLDVMTITNILGQTLKTIVQPSHNEALDVVNFATGIYLITFEKDGYRWTKEWVKQ